MLNLPYQNRLCAYAKPTAPKPVLYRPVLDQIQFCSFDRGCKTCLDTKPVLDQGRFCSLTTARRPLGVVTLLTVEQLLYWSDWICTGRAAQIEAKTKFRFGNIVPKQWTLSGFVQHTGANSMYRDDNKISRQQKVLHMNKMLERVPHFQKSFSVGIQPLS